MSITGATTLTKSDLLAFTVHRLLPNFFSWLAICLPFWVAMWAFSASHAFWVYAAADPVWAGQQFILWLRPSIGWIVVFFLFVLSYRTFYGWRRLSGLNKSLSYEAANTGLITTDAAGAALTLPWTHIKRLRRTRRLFLMQMVTGGWRYVPWRAFSAEDQAALWLVAQTHVAPKASKEYTAR